MAKYTILTSILLSEVNKNKIKEIAVKEDRSFNSIVNKIIENYEVDYGESKENNK